MNPREGEEERIRLRRAIEDWNASRLDLFEITPPDQNLEFHGVMRFFYQDELEKISTKCIRVSSTATTRDVIETLIDKFHPDMRMLTRPELSLYEVHVGGEERMLQLNELPLRVQLNWTKDLREGRFLLRNASAKSKPNFHQTGENEAQTGNFKRKLSKREKKELKKKEKEAKIKGITLDDSAQPKLYDNLSKTFTRTISNPEGVLRRKRQQKVEMMERYMQRPDDGGILKVYAHTVFPEANYKTMLLPLNTPSSFIVKQSLKDFGHPKENPDYYCLVRVILPPGADPNDYVKEKGWNQEAIMDEDELPLEYLKTKRPEGKGEIIFELKKRPADYQPRPKKRKNFNQDRLPYLLELNLDGTDIIDYKPVRHRVMVNVTEVGSQRDPNSKSPFLELHSPDIMPRHCVIANMEGVVTLTPTHPDAVVTVDDQQLHETMVLQHGNVVRFANSYTYRFCDPRVEDPGWEDRQRILSPNSHSVETTFDVTGNIETMAAQEPVPAPRVPVKLHILPATLDFREASEDAFLKAVIGQVNGAHVHFKLAPTYALYLACRYRLSKEYRPKLDLAERTQRLTPFINKIADMIDTTVREQYQIAMGMTFWLANGSEFHHFLQKDLDISKISQDAQDILFQSTQDAFRHLVRRIRFELNVSLGAFFIASGEVDIDKDLDGDEQMKAKENERWMSPPTRNQRRGPPSVGEVLHILSSVMTLLRRCRVNAAMTIQLFSQIFHFINVFLFNRFFAPPPHPKLCSRAWGERLQRRLDRIFEWAEKQGLELAANAHLTKVHQAIKLMAMEKGTRATLEAACEQAHKLNSRQLGTLLEMYVPGQGEVQIPRNVITEMVTIHKKANDEADVNIGRPLVLEEDPELRIPIIIAEDGYSSDIVKDVPNGLPEFLEPLVKAGMARFSVNVMAIGTWTIYMHERPPTPEPIPETPKSPTSPPPTINKLTGKPMPQVKADARPPPEKTEPDIIVIDLDKGGSPSMGLSIVALKPPNHEKMGIYVKAVVPGGAGHKDGRVKAGDQILEVDGNNIVGLNRDEATKFLVSSGRIVRLKVAQQGGIFHGLAQILSQQSPPMQRANLGQQRQPQEQAPVPQPRRMDPQQAANDWREVSTMPRKMPNFSQDSDMSKSSPNLATDEKSSTLPTNQRYSSHFDSEPRGRGGSISDNRPQERPRILQKGGLAQRSKSTSNLDPDTSGDYDDYPSLQSRSSTNLATEQPYRGRALPEQSPFRSPMGKVFVDQLEHEPYRRQPQPREEPMPVPQPRGRPGPQNTGPQSLGHLFNEPSRDNRHPPQTNGQQPRLPPQGQVSQPMMMNQQMVRPDARRNPAAMDPRMNRPDPRMNPAAMEPHVNRPDPRLGGPGDPNMYRQDPRMTRPVAPPQVDRPDPRMVPPQVGRPDPRMNPPQALRPDPRMEMPLAVRPDPRMAPPQVDRLDPRFDPPQAVRQDPRMAGPMNPPMNMPDPRMNGPSREPPSHLRIQDPRNSQSRISPGEPGRPYPSASLSPSSMSETHFPAEEPKRDLLTRQAPQYSHPPQPAPVRQEPPRPVNYEVPFADLPPPPEDLRSPVGAPGMLDDLPPPPPPPGEWDDELDDYQKMFEEQQKQLEEELKLLQAADDDLQEEQVPAPVIDRPAYASLPRQGGRINQSSTPLGDQSRPPLQRQPSNGPIPVETPKPPNGRRLSSGSEDSRSQVTSITNLMPAAGANPAISPSAWDRDAKERKEEWYEIELLKRKNQEIENLARTPNRTSQQEDRLRKLQMEVEFQKRVREAQEEEDGESNTDEEVTRATVKARMVEMVVDNTGNSLSQMLSRPPPDRDEDVGGSGDSNGQAERLRQLKEERMRQQEREDGIRKQEDEMQRRYEQQRMEYDRREAQIEQERLRLEQQLNLRNQQPAPQLSNQTHPYKPPGGQGANRVPPPVNHKPSVPPKPAVAPKPGLKVQMPAGGSTQNGPTNNNIPSSADARSYASPGNSQNLNVYRTGGGTPKVIGSQEVYHNPYERKIMSGRAKQAPSPASPAQPLSFRDKLKAFSEDGNTPETKKPYTSKWEREFISENPDLLEG